MLVILDCTTDISYLWYGLHNSNHIVSFVRLLIVMDLTGWEIRIKLEMWFEFCDPYDSSTYVLTALLFVWCLFTLPVDIIYLGKRTFLFFLPVGRKIISPIETTILSKKKLEVKKWNQKARLCTSFFYYYRISSKWPE